MRRVRKWLTFVGVSTSHPLAFLVVGVYVIIWLAFDPGSFNWQSAATVATWIMTLFIQRAEHRDTQAIHAKLDELLRAEGKARDELTMVDQREPEERLRPIGRWRSVTDKIRRETPTQRASGV
jgi:low affinity Fe/Cu permease